MTDSIKGNFNGHTVSVVLPGGEGEYVTLRFECKEADVASSPCSKEQCQMEEIFGDIGWDVVRAAGEIELTRLSARVDWSDPEEPWIELEP
jgi:hypothetical protein